MLLALIEASTDMPCCWVIEANICVPVRVFAALERTEAQRDPCQLLQTATT